MTDGNDHPILTAVGVVAVALGLLMAFVPGFAAAIGTGYAAVTAVGLLALVQGLRVARARQGAAVEAAETPDVETVESVPTPGEEFDRTVAELRSGPRRMLVRERSDLRDTLREEAVTAVADRDNCSPERAREQIADGSWTDDPHAAAFLGGDDVPAPPLLDRLRLAASTESRNQHRIRRTADAVARAAGVVPDDEETSDGPGGGTADGAAGSGRSRPGGWLSRLRSWRGDDGRATDASSADADAGSGATGSAARGGSTSGAGRAARTDADRRGTDADQRETDAADSDRRTEAEA